MIRLDYAASQIGAVWKMGWNRPGWEETLDRTVDGVFKSFWAIFLAVPFSFLGFYSARRFAERTPDATESLLAHAPFALVLGIHSVAFLADWGVQLAALIFCARALSIGWRITDVIVGFNWLQLIITMVQSAPYAVLGVTGALDSAKPLFLVTSIFVLAFLWGYLRRSFAARISPTIGLMVVVLLVGLLTNLIIGGLASMMLRPVTIIVQSGS